MIAFNHIHLSFNGKKVLDDLSLAVERGEKVVILGKSGSGKSSLFSLLLGFLEPDAGEIFFAGRRVDEKSVWEVRRKVAYIDQDVSLGSGTIFDLLDFIARLKTNLHLGQIRKEADELRHYFELSDEVLNKNIEELSGGERQRLAVMIAVLLHRDVFLLDEVTSALDLHLKKKVADFFIDRKDWTCLVISHDPVWLENPAVKVFDLEEKTWRL